MPTRTVVQHGPKDKKVAAFAIDWPGWSRGAKTGPQAVELLEAYRDRYRPVAGLAGLASEFDAAGPLEIVEDHAGDTYRAIYTVRLADAGYVLHAFQKKSKKGIETPKHVIDLIRARLRTAQRDHQ